MQKESTDVWQCDCCPKEETTHDTLAPVGWFEVVFINSPQALILAGQDPGKDAEEWEVCSQECLLRTIQETGKLISKMDDNNLCILTVTKMKARPVELPEPVELPAPTDGKG